MLITEVGPANSGKVAPGSRASFECSSQLRISSAAAAAAQPQPAEQQPLLVLVWQCRSSSVFGSRNSSPMQTGTFLRVKQSHGEIRLDWAIALRC